MDFRPENLRFSPRNFHGMENTHLAEADGSRKKRESVFPKLIKLIVIEVKVKFMVEVEIPIRSLVCSSAWSRVCVCCEVEESKDAAETHGLMENFHFDSRFFRLSFFSPDTCF